MSHVSRNVVKQPRFQVDRRIFRKSCDVLPPVLSNTVCVVGAVLTDDVCLLKKRLADNCNWRRK